MLYSYTHMATAGVKELITYMFGFIINDCYKSFVCLVHIQFDT